MQAADGMRPWHYQVQRRQGHQRAAGLGCPAAADHARPPPRGLPPIRPRAPFAHRPACLTPWPASWQTCATATALPRRWLAEGSASLAPRVRRRCRRPSVAARCSESASATTTTAPLGLASRVRACPVASKPVAVTGACRPPGHRIAARGASAPARVRPPPRAPPPPRACTRTRRTAPQTWSVMLARVTRPPTVAAPTTTLTSPPT